MGFNFKEMYSFLLSHTFPGLLLLVEILLFLRSTAYPDIFVSPLPDKYIAILILAGYAFSTLLGTMLDGIQHSIFDLFIDPGTDKERIRKKFMAIKDNKDMEVYKHFIEDDFWYPYEAYANISIAIFLGLILLGCEKFPIFTPSLRFWLGAGIISCITLAALSYEAWRTYTFCSDEEEQFSDVYSKKDRLMFKVEVVHVINENFIDDIVRIDQGSCPPSWPKINFSKILKEENNVRIILKDDGIIVGYLLAVPHNNARKDLENDDPLIREDVLRYYIESVAILPAYRGKDGLSEMLEMLIKELRKKGIYKLSMHARVSNKFSNFIQRKMKVTQIRKIDGWKYYNYEEPTDYIEATFE